jgi:hypothetical protein
MTSSTVLSLIHPDSVNVILGQFNYIVNKSKRLMLVNAWKAITLTETWDFVKNNSDSFMFNNNKIIGIISQAMLELGYNLHSCSSFGYTMRTMQFIAIHGEKIFKDQVLKEKID